MLPICSFIPYLTRRLESLKAQLEINVDYVLGTLPGLGFNLKILYILYAFPYSNTSGWPVPVAARSKAYVYDHSPAETVGSNTTRGHVCLSVASVVCCQVEVSVTR